MRITHGELILVHVPGWLQIVILGNGVELMHFCAKQNQITSLICYVFSLIFSAESHAVRILHH